MQVVVTGGVRTVAAGLIVAAATVILSTSEGDSGAYVVPAVTDTVPALVIYLLNADATMVTPDILFEPLSRLSVNVVETLSGGGVITLNMQTGIHLPFCPET